MEGELLGAMLERKGYLMPVTDIVDQLKATADSYGVPFGDLEKNYNSRLMQEVDLWAQEEGRGPAFHQEGFKANFVTNQNLADTDLLLQIVHKVGLDTEKAREIIEQRSYREAVEKDWGDVERDEIVAAPTYLIGGDRLVGAQSYENLEKLIVQHGAKKRG